ncbi:related to alpha/beta hydrolase [Cephalotrichum gorgonifer]|uniref:Related to alpha/beta hydrolase n=1 Tax=Cephalotrichum gorgonifer TaxID=2041049 RepID=A0AAE8SVM3_9PEZI|nr:related to alpha/beta hydrolase [Cephalotrichum gorgonifer]
MPSEQKQLPTIAETLEHPAYPGTVWGLEPHRKGRLAVGEGRGGPFDIAWEVHGDGPIKIIFIMGLAGLKTAWQRQTKHFGHDQSSYSVLILDNRGMGESSLPMMRYTTSSMALDCIEVLSHLDWIPTDWTSSPPASRSVHLVGISLGGMIAQEIAYRIPAYLSSLTLLCTAASVENTKGWLEFIRDRAGMVIPKSMEQSIEDTARKLFPESWLHAPDDTPLPSPTSTPRCAPAPGGGEYVRFDNNFQRFQAQELTKKLDPVLFSTPGFLLQLGAAALHHKSAAQLAELGDGIGRERVMVMHGTADKMIDPVLGERLVQGLRPGRAEIVPGMGHAPLMEMPVWLNSVLEEHVTTCERMERGSVV